MSGQDDQLELLPSEALNVRRASLSLAELVGYEHASPSRELVELIAKLGLLQPVVVTAIPLSRYSIIEGRRRVKAIEQLAGENRWPSPPHVPALIVSAPENYRDPAHAGMALALHAARSPSPASELRAIEAILDGAGEDREVSTIKEIAAQTGMPVQTVRRRLRLRGLAPALRAAFDHGTLGASVAEAAARLGGQQQAALERRLEDGERLTLGAVRELARERTNETVVELPRQVFADTEVPWRVTVRGHLHAALKAVPASEAHPPLAECITAAARLLETADHRDAEPASPGVAR